MSSLPHFMHNFWVWIGFGVFLFFVSLLQVNSHFVRFLSFACIIVGALVFLA